MIFKTTHNKVIKNFENHTFRIYLAGPMDFTKGNQKTQWRKSITTFLNYYIDNVQVINPCNIMDKNIPKFEKAFNMKLTDKETMSPKIYFQNSGKYYDWFKTNVVRKDLQEMLMSDCVILYIPLGAATIGTIHEIIKAQMHRKPLFYIYTSNNPLDNISSWLSGLIPPKYTFDSWYNHNINYSFPQKIKKHITSEKLNNALKDFPISSTHYNSFIDWFLLSYDNFRR